MCQVILTSALQSIYGCIGAQMYRGNRTKSAKLYGIPSPTGGQSKTGSGAASTAVAPPLDGAGGMMAGVEQLSRC